MIFGEKVLSMARYLCPSVPVSVDNDTKLYHGNFNNPTNYFPAKVARQSGDLNYISPSGRTGKICDIPS